MAIEFRVREFVRLSFLTYTGKQLDHRARTMKKYLIALSGLTALVMATAGNAYAQSDVYICKTENGGREYRNTGVTKDCKRMEMPPGTLITAPVKKPLTQTAASKPASSPAEFPKVDSATQKARDSDRRQILVDEMRTEEQKLAELKKDFNNGEPERRGDERNYAKYQERLALMKDDLSRTEKNIEALKREISNLK